MDAFNIDLLILNNQDLKGVRPVKVLDIFEGGSKNFHQDGLFSIETFGKVGEERRNRLFSYIDMRVDIFHPVIYKALDDLKGLYTEIIAGKSFAIFDKQLKDFVKATPVNGGQTGFSFFCEHFPELKFEERPSTKREFNIKLINKYRNNDKGCMFSKLVVLPAGLRDYTIDENGKPSEDEINVMYRKVLSVSSMTENINLSGKNMQTEFLDSTRYSLQVAVNDIYKYITNLLEGKSKLILGKWASRKIFNSTRNVASSSIPTINDLHDKQSVSSNQTIVGLYQYLRMILPIAVKALRDGFLSQVFPGPNSPAILVNKKTLKKELVHIDPEYYDEYMTYEGLEKLMARYGQEGLRHDHLAVEDHYLGLIYKSPDKTYKLFQDIDELPEQFDKKNVHPVSFTELLYLSVFKDSHETPCFVTRYPITGYGSIYPSYVYLKSTVKSEVREELNEVWERSGVFANEFPVYGEQFFNSFSVAPSHTARLGMDFDGDTANLTALMTEDAKEEIKKTLASARYYVGINKRMTFSASDEIIDLTLANMTS